MSAILAEYVHLARKHEKFLRMRKEQREALPRREIRQDEDETITV